jgi:hypothetical protein
MKKAQEQPAKELTQAEAKRLRYVVGNIKACNRLIKYCKTHGARKPFPAGVLTILLMGLTDEGKKILKNTNDTEEGKDEREQV